jgi:hypothetical protein
MRPGSTAGTLGPSLYSIIRVVYNCSSSYKVVAPQVHAPSRAPLFLPLQPSFTQSPFPPRSLVRDRQISTHKPRLVISHSTRPPLSPSPLAKEEGGGEGKCERERALERL